MWLWECRAGRKIGTAAVILSLFGGCHRFRPALHYLGEPHNNYYRAHVEEIDYPTVVGPTPPEVAETEPPHTIRDQDKVPIRDMTLAEAVHLGLSNSQVIRSAGTFLSPGNQLLANPNNVESVYDPAIQETGVLFGGRGVEGALAAFDAQLSASMIWGRNETIQNNIFFGGGLQPGRTLVQETGAFQASLSKTFAYGGTFSLNHNVNYLGLNLGQPQVLFPSVYTGNVQLQYSQPLLAGAGAEFTRIAGPIGQAFGGLTGVSQGVLIARINNDLTLVDFEASVHNLLRDIETAYWDLYLAYRNHHTAVTAKESALLTWRIADLQLEEGVRNRADVAQARDQYFTAEAAADTTQSNIFTAEVRLRRLIGLPANDGTVIRPVDQPVTAELIPDWYSSLSEALTRRWELRRQKWNIKSFELQLRAARSLTRPQLNLVGSYQVNGFGDDLFSYNNVNSIGASQNVNSLYQTITQGDQTGWNLGFQFNMPIGFRAAHAQVRNYELRLAKAQKVLQEQEKEISMELAATFQEVARAYSTAQTNLNRLLAARENVRYLEPSIREGERLLDELLRAQTRQADAEVAFYQSVIDYNKALMELEYRKGTLLAHNNITLAEGPWVPPAYEDAEHHSEARAHAIPNPLLRPAPEPFASSMPVGAPVFTTPEAASMAEPHPADELPLPPEMAPEKPSATRPAVPPPAERIEVEPPTGGIIPMSGRLDRPKNPADPARSTPAPLNKVGSAKLGD